MRAAVPVPVTVKMRIGVLGAGARRANMAAFDEQDYEQLRHFTALVAAAGCDHFIVHARKAVLGGLSPKENREVPPLRYEVVQRLQPGFSGAVDRRQWRPAHGGAEPRSARVGRAGSCSAARPITARSARRAAPAVFADGWRAPEVDALLERMAIYAEREVAAGEHACRRSPGTCWVCWRADPAPAQFRQLLSEGASRLGSGPGAATAVRRLLQEARERLAA